MVIRYWHWGFSSILIIYYIKADKIADQIIKKTRSIGASLVGIASVENLKKSPSHEIYTKIEPNQGVGSRDYEKGVKPGEVAWPFTYLYFNDSA